MEFLIIVAVLIWIVAGVINGAVRQAKAKLPPPEVYQAVVVPPEHVRHLAAPAAVPVSAGRFAVFEESTSEYDADELAGDTELQLYRQAQAEVHSMEPLESRDTVLTTIEARPLPEAPVTLEHEVDWTAEHERFHQRYVDAKAPPHLAQRGLLDDMRDPAMVRRAVLMAEILGPPVGVHGIADPADR